MERIEKIYYSIEKALFLIHGGNCSKPRARYLYRTRDYKYDKVLNKLLMYVNNNYFDEQTIFTWVLYRYLTTGKDGFPDIQELDIREISRARKEFYKNKLTADTEFLTLICRKVGKEYDFLNALNTDGKSNLYLLYEANKIGIYTLIDRMEHNTKNAEENQIYNRIDKIKKQLQQRYTK